MIDFPAIRGFLVRTQAVACDKSAPVGDVAGGLCPARDYLSNHGTAVTCIVMFVPAQGALGSICPSPEPGLGKGDADESERMYLRDLDELAEVIRNCDVTTPKALKKVTL